MTKYEVRNAIRSYGFFATYAEASRAAANIYHNTGAFVVVVSHTA